MELLAALHRKLREQVLSRRQFEIVLRQLDLDEEQGLWTWLPLTEAISAAVTASYRRLPSSVFVRTGDMIHLVTARDQTMTEIFSSETHILAASPPRRILVSPDATSSRRAADRPGNADRPNALEVARPGGLRSAARVHCDRRNRVGQPKGPV
jgi:hypothetical protein